jgi:signal transduction histidine kinase
MWERVRALEGQVTITSQPGTGTLVTLSLPVGLEQLAVNA